MKTAEEKFSIKSDYKGASIKQMEGRRTKDEYKIVFAKSLSDTLFHYTVTPLSLVFSCSAF